MMRVSSWWAVILASAWLHLLVDFVFEIITWWFWFVDLLLNVYFIWWWRFLLVMMLLILLLLCEGFPLRHEVLLIIEAICKSLFMRGCLLSLLQLLLLLIEAISLLLRNCCWVLGVAHHHNWHQIRGSLSFIYAINELSIL